MMVASKLKVLIIPDFIGWAFGTIAQEIVRWSQDYDCQIVSLSFITEHPAKFKDASKGFDLIHYLPPSGFDSMRELLGPYCSYVSSIHHVVEWKKVADIVNADAVMAISEEWKEFIIKQGVPATKVVKVPVGVDTDRFHPIPESEISAIRRRLHIPEGSFVIGSFGKQTPYLSSRKGTDVLVEAVKALAAKRKDLCLLTVGVGWQAAFKELRGSGARLINVPYVSSEEVPQFYNAVDCYWVTSRIEGGPLPLIESMSCQKPVITTPVGLAKDLVIDGQNAILVEKDKPIAFVQKTLELMSRPEVRARIGVRGRETVINGYQWSHYAMSIPYLYKVALANCTISTNEISRANRQVYFDRIKPTKKNSLEEDMLWIKYVRKSGELVWADRMQYDLWKKNPFEVPLPNPLLRFFPRNTLMRASNAIKKVFGVQRRVSQ